MKNKTKLYCYVDKSGQDTKGNVFLADALAGFVRDALEDNDTQVSKMLDSAIKKGGIINV